MLDFFKFHFLTTIQEAPKSHGGQLISGLGNLKNKKNTASSKERSLTRQSTTICKKKWRKFEKNTPVFHYSLLKKCYN